MKSILILFSPIYSSLQVRPKLLPPLNRPKLTPNTPLGVSSLFFLISQRQLKMTVSERDKGGGVELERISIECMEEKWGFHQVK
jgi:hypothetical protein